MGSEEVLKDYRKCKDRLIRLKSLRDKLEGQEEGVHEVMLQKFDVGTLEEAETLLDKLEKERNKLLSSLEDTVTKMKTIIKDAENAELAF